MHSSQGPDSPIPLPQIGHKFMIFHNWSYFDTPYFNSDFFWRKNKKNRRGIGGGGGVGEGGWVVGVKSPARGLGVCVKILLYMLRQVVLQHPALSLSLSVNLSSQNVWHYAGHCEELHLRKGTPELDSWIFILWLGALIYRAAGTREQWALRSLGT